MPAQARPVDPAPVAADADRPTAIALRTTELAKAFGPTQACARARSSCAAVRSTASSARTGPASPRS